MRTLRVISAIFVKDLRVEWRHRETLASMCIFGLLVVFLFNFAFEPGREETLRLLPGLMWIAFAFAGVLGFNRSFAAERENGGLEGMRLAPVDPGGDLSRQNARQPVLHGDCGGRRGFRDQPLV